MVLKTGEVIPPNHPMYNFPFPDGLRRTTLLQPLDKIVLLYLYYKEDTEEDGRFLDFPEIMKETGTVQVEDIENSLHNLRENKLILTEIRNGKEYFSCIFNHEIYEGGFEDESDEGWR